VDGFVNVGPVGIQDCQRERIADDDFFCRSRVSVLYGNGIADAVGANSFHQRYDITLSDPFL
jgi:hypothetical protein